MQINKWVEEKTSGMIKVDVTPFSAEPYVTNFTGNLDRKSAWTSSSSECSLLQRSLARHNLVLAVILECRSMEDQV